VTPEPSAQLPEASPPASIAPPPDSASEIVKALKDWKPAKDLNDLYQLTRASLDEVSRLTQYQDEKASRILTAIAFLSALAGGVYGGIVSKGVLHPSFQLVCHLLFFAFAAVVIVGAGFVIYGIRPSFNIPKSWNERRQHTSQSSAAVKPPSFLFALQLIKTDPAQWATAFSSGGSADELRVEYIKNQILEAYLVAEKVATKLRPLQKGMFCFLVGIILLLVWFVAVAGGIVAGADSNHKTGANEGAVVIFTDADNTLWDTNGLYAAAQRAMLAHVEAFTGKHATGDPLEFVRRIDQRIGKDHPQGLRYPPQLLVRGLTAELTNSGSETRPSPAIAGTRPTTKPFDEFVETEAVLYLETIGGIPELRPGVRRGLERLHKEHYPLVVLTEGSETSALKRLNHHGLMPLIDRVVELRKSADAYRQAAQQFGPQSKLNFMIGDQIDRDIQFSAQAGFKTVYFPGGFTPAWLPDIGAVKPDYQIVSYDQAADAVHSVIEQHHLTNDEGPQ
jgi:putative hydrolase of the HAD superfamily